MSHPYHHAMSSVKQFGGQESDYLEIHQWFDATKSHMANYRHRALRHHTLGAEIASAVFDQRRISYNGMLVNSDGANVTISQIAEQHVREDCGQYATAVDWVLGLRAETWMLGLGYHKSPEEHAIADAKQHGGVPEDYIHIHKWFHVPASRVGGFKARFFLYHSQGIFTCEEVFGATLCNSAGRVIPVRQIAEAHVLATMGQIPTTTNWLSAIVAEPWMHVRTTKLSKQFSEATSTEV